METRGEYDRADRDRTLDEGDHGPRGVTANDNRPPRRERPSSTRSNVAALVAIVVIGLALFWAVTAVRQHNAVQDCIDSGRHDCAEAP